MNDTIKGFENLRTFHILKQQLVVDFDPEKGSWTGSVSTYSLAGERPEDKVNEFVFKSIDRIIGEKQGESSFDKEDMVICFNVKNDPNGFNRYYFTFLSQSQKSFDDGYLPRDEEVYRFVDLDRNDFKGVEGNAE